MPLKNQSSQERVIGAPVSTHDLPSPALWGQRLIQDLRSRSDPGSCQPVGCYLPCRRGKCSGHASLPPRNVFIHSGGARLPLGLIGDLHSGFCYLVSDGAAEGMEVYMVAGGASGAKGPKVKIGGYIYTFTHTTLTYLAVKKHVGCNISKVSF